MLENILILIAGAVIAIVSGWITSLREHNLRMIEEESRRNFETAKKEQEKRYEIVLAKAEKAERILDELEDGFYSLMPIQEHICRGERMSVDERKKLLVPLDNTSKNFSKMLVFDDEDIKKMMGDLVQIYVEEFAFTDTLNQTESGKLPDVSQNMIRGSLQFQRVTGLSGKIRKRIDDMKISFWTPQLSESSQIPHKAKRKQPPNTGSSGRAGFSRP